jgi:L-ascorbate metabolism protein UlaG (beta-lactamase superfamily)
MDRIVEDQARIDRQRAEIVNRYPSTWDKMITEWNLPGPENRAWLMYSANYLFRTHEIRWALDPLTLHWRLPAAPHVDAARDLRDLSFIILTHAHADHLDLDLVRDLSALPIRWVIPEFLLGVVVEAGLSRAKIIVPKPMETFELDGLRITPFDGQHWQTDPANPNGRRGVAATGYLVEFSGKRWLFPGDTRTYDASKIPFFGSVDGLFAHLWLGRGCALDEKPALLEPFCSFCLDLHPKRIIVTHLDEFGRAADDYWEDAHFQQVKQRILERVPDMVIESANHGERVDL